MSKTTNEANKKFEHSVCIILSSFYLFFQFLSTSTSRTMRYVTIFSSQGNMGETAKKVSTAKKEIKKRKRFFLQTFLDLIRKTLFN